MVVQLMFLSKTEKISPRQASFDNTGAQSLFFVFLHLLNESSYSRALNRVCTGYGNSGSSCIPNVNVHVG